jgi:hypothetical protein
VGHDARCTFVENFDLTIYFSKIMKIKYKKYSNPYSGLL